MVAESRGEGPAERAVAAGVEITGSMAGAAAGLLLAGPPGVLGGAAAGPMITAGLREVTRRVLSRREEARTGGAFLAAAEALQERQEAGQRFRDDGFFIRNKGRADADEVVEGVLLAAQRSYEERKVPYMGYLMSNVCFEEQIDGHLANWAIKTAQELTWAQFVFLSAVGRDDMQPLPEIELGKDVGGWGSWGLHEQLADLGWARREMILGKARRTERLGLSQVNVALQDQYLTRSGLLLYDLLWLSRIPKISVLDVLDRLTAKPSSES